MVIVMECCKSHYISDRNFTISVTDMYNTAMYSTTEKEKHQISSSFVGIISYFTKNGGRNYHKYMHKSLTDGYKTCFWCYIIC